MNQKFSQIILGMFTSKLMYCSSVWGGVWGIPGAKDMNSNTTRTSITKDYEEAAGPAEQDY